MLERSNRFECIQKLALTFLLRSSMTQKGYDFSCTAEYSFVIMKHKVVE